MEKKMYCVEEVYERYLPGDTSPWFDTEPDYSKIFETYEETEAFCEKYNDEHKGEWPQLHPHIMTDGDMREMKEREEREYEMFDRL